MHMAMRKAGYEMPALNSAICSMKFMKRVRKGYFSIPKRQQTANCPECFSYPDKHVLISKLVQYGSKQKPTL